MKRVDLFTRSVKEGGLEDVDEADAVRDTAPPPKVLLGAVVQPLFVEDVRETDGDDSGDTDDSDSDLKTC